MQIQPHQFWRNANGRNGVVARRYLDWIDDLYAALQRANEEHYKRLM